MNLPTLAIALPMLAAALAAGHYIANGRLGLSVAIVIAIPFLALVFLNFTLALALWAVLLFIVHLSILSVAPTAVEILLFCGWIGTAGVRRGRMPVLGENQRLAALIVVFGIWLSLSAAWATEPSRSLSDAANWWQTIIAFFIVMTTLATLENVRTLAIFFVAGAVVSVAIGLAGYGGPTTATRIAAVGDRLTGGGGDPNYQAAAFLAAMFLSGGLVTTVRTRGRRFLCGAALAFITVGFLAAQSRGGLLALGFATAAALILLPGQRKRVLAAIAAGGIGLATWVIVRHDALTRLTDFSGGTSGRADQWTVALRVWKQHPIFGAGLDNFIVLEPRYVLRGSGQLTDVHLVAETPELVHNAYLQLLTETGVIGLALFLLVVWFCLRATWSAIHRFEGLGEPGYADLARAVLIGTIGMLAAIFFISDSNDFRLWMLFAMGVLLDTVARRRQRAARARAVASRRQHGQTGEAPSAARRRREISRPRAPTSAAGSMPAAGSRVQRR